MSTTNKMFTRLMLVLCMICFISFASPVAIKATGLDGLGSQSETSSSDGSSSSDDGNAMSDYLSGYNAVTSDNMQSANTLASPIANAIGTITGFIMIIVSAGIFLITALDLAYIALPFIRPTLNPAQAGGGAAGGMGGMPMGGAPMGGGQPQRRKWISDEAEACVAQAGGGGAQAGGMSMGGGMMPGGMGAPMGGGQPQPTKSVILMYLKKRAFFLIIFAVASIVLMSSIFTDCGINLAALLTKIMNKFNGSIANVQV